MCYFVKDLGVGCSRIVGHCLNDTTFSRGAAGRGGEDQTKITMANPKPQSDSRRTISRESMEQRESDRHRYMDQKVHHSHRSLGRSGSESGDGGKKKCLSPPPPPPRPPRGNPKNEKRGAHSTRGVGGRRKRRFAKGTFNIRLIEEPLLRLLRDSDVSREKMKFGISSSSFFSDCLCLSS